MHLTELRLTTGEYVIVASPSETANAPSDYDRRLEIEILFGCLKSRGFRLEEAHVTDPARLENGLNYLRRILCYLESRAKHAEF